MSPYRGKTKEGKLVYGWYCKWGRRHYIFDPKYSMQFLACFIEVIPDSVVQFVIKDKNGKDVYAGDSVRSGKRVLTIVWSKDSMQWKAKEDNYLTPLCQWAISEQFELIVEDKEDG